MGRPTPPKSRSFSKKPASPTSLTRSTPAGDQFSWISGGQPERQVPAIVDGGVTVFDSNAILLYLAEKTGKFLPSGSPGGRAGTAVLADVRCDRGRPVLRRSGALPAPATEKTTTRTTVSNSRRSGISASSTPPRQRRYMVGDTYTIVDMDVWGWAACSPSSSARTPSEIPNVKRLIDESRPAAAAKAIALKDNFNFKAEMDDEAREHVQAWR